MDLYIHNSRQSLEFGSKNIDWYTIIKQINNNILQYGRRSFLKLCNVELG